MTAAYQPRPLKDRILWHSGFDIEADRCRAQIVTNTTMQSAYQTHALQAMERDGIDVDAISNKLFRCDAVHLNKAAAATLIDYLKEGKR